MGAEMDLMRCPWYLAHLFSARNAPEAVFMPTPGMASVPFTALGKEAEGPGPTKVSRHLRSS